MERCFFCQFLLNVSIICSDKSLSSLPFHEPLEIVLHSSVVSLIPKSLVLYYQMSPSIPNLQHETNVMKLEKAFGSPLLKYNFVFFLNWKHSFLSLTNDNLTLDCFFTHLITLALGKFLPSLSSNSITVETWCLKHSISNGSYF